MNVTSEINLARKLRPTTFEQVIGQDLTIRLLKNSLYRQQFFPVYLLAGQRGCGKTTVGRIFAAAVNCARLDDFSHSPSQISLPCGACTSCVAMSNGKHPDFIEIDAASHTGVDNIRQIIEATSFLPQLGRKKMYLIDEAHMLSKAAFNALLKILEEPPASVLFLMATTDQHKILETVKSRCFQLFFDPLPVDVLVNYLANICDQEKLPYDQIGLQVVAQHAQGSVRDALNTVERVRLAYHAIDAEAVGNIVGMIDDEHIVVILEHIVRGKTGQLFVYMRQSTLSSATTQSLWKRLLEGLRVMLWMKHAVICDDFVVHAEQLQALSAEWDIKNIVAAMNILYEIEQCLMKTIAPYAYLEMVLARIALELAVTPTNSVVPEKAVKRATPKIIAPHGVAAKDLNSSSLKSEVEFALPEVVQVQENRELTTQLALAWQKFLATISSSDQMVISMLRQSRIEEDAVTKDHINIVVPKKLAFFSDELLASVPTWKDAFIDAIGKQVSFDFSFIDEKIDENVSVSMADKAPSSSTPPSRFHSGLVRGVSSSKTGSLDLSDTTKWNKTHSMLQLFPGTVSEIKEYS